MSLTLLVIAHTPSDNTRDLAAAISAGAKEENAIDVRQRQPLDILPRDILSADGIVLFTTENFGYMSGAMKDMFDRCYYPCLEQTQGTPYALCVRAGKDGTGATLSVKNIVNGLRWKAVQDPVILKGRFEPGFIHSAKQLGKTIATGLAVGIF